MADPVERRRRLGGFFFGSGRRSSLTGALIFLAILIPVAVAGVYSYVKTKQDLTASTLSRRQTIAFLAATILKEKLDRLADIGVSLATRVQFRRLIMEEKWEQAIAILGSIPLDFPIIHRIFLTDPAGTLRVDVPAIFPVRGSNFAFREWYQGVVASGRPYVSNIYTRTAEPRYHVIAVAVPIRSTGDALIGILVLQVQLDVFDEWTKDIDVGPGGFVFFVDRKGKVAGHPKYPPQRELIDFSSVPSVQEALRGERGVSVVHNPVEGEDIVAAYEPVPGFGWGVIAQQPTAAAFTERDQNLRRIVFIYGVIFLLSLALAALILRTFLERRKAERETRALNAELRRGTAELEAANKELEAFSYSVSHDLRSPLRAIDGFSRILEEKHEQDLPPEPRRYLGLIRKNTRHMGLLIDDLLTFSRLGRQPLTKRSVNCAELARQALEDLRADQGNDRLDIVIDAMPLCEGDSALLRQVWINLIGNALKYTRKRDKAVIEIGFADRDGAPAFFVRDNGVGFDMRYADKLFNVFQRLHRAEDYEGTGVGLAIVRRVVQRHGGRVWAEAELDKGATFYFTLDGGARDE